MWSQFLDVPFWAALAMLGAAGGMFRYLRSKKQMTRKDVVAFIGLGSVLGPSITMMMESAAMAQGVAVGRPAQCLLCLVVGGASVYLFDRFGKTVEWAGDKAAGAAEKKIGDKVDDPPEEKKP